MTCFFYSTNCCIFCSSPSTPCHSANIFDRPDRYPTIHSSLYPACRSASAADSGAYHTACLHNTLRRIDRTLHRRYIAGAFLLTLCSSVFFPGKSKFPASNTPALEVIFAPLNIPKLPYSLLAADVRIFKHQIFITPRGLYIALFDRLYMILIPHPDLFVSGLNALTLYIGFGGISCPFGLYLYLDHSFF